MNAILGDGGDGPIRWPAYGLGRADLDDAADPRILNARRVDAGKMMGAPVDAIDHDGQVLAQLVGQIFVDDAADDRDFGRGVDWNVIGSRSNPSAFSALCMLRMMSPRSPSSRSAGSIHHARTPGACSGRGPIFPAWRDGAGAASGRAGASVRRARAQVEAVIRASSVMARSMRVKRGPGRSRPTAYEALLDLGDGTKLSVARSLARSRIPLAR